MALVAESIEVLSPIALPPRSNQQRWQPVPQVKGARVILVNNHWTSMDQIAAVLTERLVNECQVASVKEISPPTSSAPPAGMLEAAAQEADLAIVGLAN